MSYHLFIGGPADGEWRNVSYDAATWRVSVYKSVVDYESPPQMMEDLSFEVHNYKREYLQEHLPGRREPTIVTIYTHESLVGYGIIRALIDGYRKPKEQES